MVVALGHQRRPHRSRPAADADKRIDEVMALVAGKPVLWVNIYRADTKGTMAAADLFDQQLTPPPAATRT